MISKEATARIKINKLLEAAGWRFFPEGVDAANISLEPGVKIKEQDLDNLGHDFEKVHKGFIDFLLMDEKSFPLIVLEAKSEDRNPLVGKEQARSYARSMNCRFILLSNGNLHYFWDLERGNPYLITTSPTPQSTAIYHRPYQLEAIHALQRGVEKGADRFLFEMATGTGKTLTAAAVIKLFLKSGNTGRVLFLVDRLELEEQARKNFIDYLSNDFTTVVYKENRDDWRRAEIVVTTVQSLLFDNKYQRLFSPTDFIQIKGRGTRKHSFLEQLFDPALAEAVREPEKRSFKLFDFFANCEYFEEKFDYDEILKLPAPKAKKKRKDNETLPPELIGLYSHEGEDILATIEERKVGFEGMKIDRMFFERFEDVVRANDFITATVATGQWDRVIDYINKEVFDKPEEYYSLDKLRKAATVDRRLTLREILEKVFGLIPRFKSKDELLEEEFAKFVADAHPSEEEATAIPAIKAYFKAYISPGGVRDIIESRHYTELATNPLFSSKDFKAVPVKYRLLIPEYVKDYVPLNAFIA